MLKRELRFKYSTLRKSLSSETITNCSLAIANNLFDIPIWSFDYYHIFLPIIEKREIDTSFILTVLQGKDKNIVVPKVITDTTFVSFLLTDNTQFIKNKWGVVEPMEGLEVPPTKIDVVFLPLLAYDLTGNRVGYGKGFYDSFLRQCRPAVVKIGLSLFPPEKTITDVWQGDIAMDYCVTPAKTYGF